jgi:hypothetical protein
VRKRLAMSEVVGGQRAILCVGRSATGKTTIVKKLLKSCKRVFVINEKTGDKTFQRASWDEATTLKKAALVVEDLIGASKQEFKLLQHLISFSGHHCSLSPIVVVLHSLLNNNCFALTNYVTDVIITASKSNLGSLNALLTSQRFDKTERADIVQRFLREGEPYGYFWFSVDKRRFEYFGPAGVAADHSSKKSTSAAAASIMSEASASAERYLGLLPESGTALALFSLIRARIDEKTLDPQDLTLTLRSKKKHSITISLIDYLHALTTPDAAVSKENLLFHRFISKKVRYPKVFITNSRFH